MIKTSWDIGDLHLEFVPPNFLSFKTGAVFTEEQMKGIRDFLSQRAAIGPVYLLADNTLLKEILPAAKKVAREEIRQEWMKATIVVGASLTTRIMIKALWLAMTVMGRKHSDIDFEPTWEKGEARILAIIKQDSRVAA